MKKVLFISILFLSACSKKPVEIPAHILQPDTMVSILKDIHLAQSSISVTDYASKSPYTMNQYVSYILERHGQSRERFMQSLRYYTGEPELMDGIYDSVIARLGNTSAQLK